MIIATAGHVDHGKTSLVNALTGVDTDRLAEEKQRGLTIDLGFAYSSAESGERLGFVDVPGHIKFINNMLAGVSAIDYSLLVVAADDGVMPQTIEHLEILKLLGIKEGVIVITKIDRCDDDQIQSTKKQIALLVAHSFLETADIYEISSITGEGIETLQLALEIAADDINARSAEGQFRLAIDRRFTVKGAGVVVTGSVFSGDVNVGDELILMPQGRKVRIRNLHTQNQEAPSARAGDRCAINITGDFTLEDIHRGNWLTTNTAASTNRVDITLNILSAESRPFRHWTPVHIHNAANHVTGRVALLEQSKINPGESGLAQLVFEPPINVCFGDRIVIRDQAALRTLGGGQVINLYSPKRGRARPQRLETLRHLDVNSIENSIEASINDADNGIARSDLQRTFNLTDDELLIMLDDQDFSVLDDDYLIAPAILNDHVDRLPSKLDAWHEANPGKAGLPQNQIAQLCKGWSKPLLDRCIADLMSSGELEQNGNLFNRPGQGIALSKEELRVWELVRPLLAADPVKPPVLHDLAKEVSKEPKVLEKMLNQVLKTGQLFRPVKNRYFLTEALPQLKQAMQKAANAEGQFTVQNYRDATGVGRNLSIEILEYFDRQGVTRRLGDVRQIVEQQ